MQLTDTINTLGQNPAPPRSPAQARRKTGKTFSELQLLVAVGLLLLLPILVVGLFAVRGHNMALSQARSEMQEQAFAGSMDQFVSAATAHHGYLEQWLAGDPAARTPVDRSARRANAAIAAIDSSSGLEQSLAPPALWQQIKDQWARLASPAGDEAVAGQKQFAALRASIEQLRDVVAQRRAQRQASRVEALQQQATLAGSAGVASIAVALIGVLVVGRKLLSGARRRQSEAAIAAQENERNQTAILQLMDELSVIAGGDLTAQAAVTEEITGAIADSINVTVGQLRKVVRDINHATEKVGTATDQAQKTARELIADSARQAEDIESADLSVEMMTRSMSEVSDSANESAEVARRSLASTERGARAVQDSIGGMNEIRQQIQETAKRIKRLGESSQEIGEIVDVITEIAEQTNVLALNAAIQAAAAGEAGRAFAVVAEEVQLLAERSADATTQIAGLVKAIQTDTQEAATAMESSIQGVVEGARLSDTAGRSLHEIEVVTRGLAEMIQRIAVSTETQVVVAEEVRKIMSDVLSVTGTTTEGSQRAASAVTDIAAQAHSLKSSVTQFKVA